MGRKRSLSTRWRISAAFLLLALCGALYAWWDFIHWTPPREAYPIQGILVGASDGTVDFRAYKTVGANFTYLEASRGGFALDRAFARNFAAAGDAHLQIGVVHEFDPCVPAEKQAANFVTIVPRDASLLPPAVSLDRIGDDCPDRVSEAAVESELTTFLNQIEGHVGKAALLKISRGFEQRYRLASRLERNLWLSRDRFQPDYAGRPWTLWTANSQLRTEAGDGPVRWVVVQP
jgi:lysozyme